MPVFNSSGAMYFGVGNVYGVGVAKYGAPTSVPSSTVLSTPEERLNDMHLSCEQWLALPLDQQRYAVYSQMRNSRPDFDIKDAPPIAQAITDSCNRIAREKNASVVVPSAVYGRPSGDVLPPLISSGPDVSPFYSAVIGVALGAAAMYFWQKLG